ncbi:MAG TPA: YihY/virulence factor BrkB family protein [Nocardioidaceae bacterium]|jgi:membrane protein
MADKGDAETGFAAGAKAKLAEARRRLPFLDHVIATQEHYMKVEGTVLAGAVTYFGFLSFFPLLAIAFGVVGYVSASFPDAREHLVTAIEGLFPGIVSANGGHGTISLKQIERAATTTGIVGLLVLLYSGLGWVYGLRAALADTFEIPRSQKRSFVLGKIGDLGVLALLGVVMIVSVGISGTVESAAGSIVSFAGLDETVVGSPLVWGVGLLLSLAASTLLFSIMYKLLANPDLPRRPILEGAVFAAIAFEVLKFVVVNIIGGVGGTSVAALAISVTLVVWINCCSRLVVYGAAWAMTSRRSSPARVGDSEPPRVTD